MYITMCCTHLVMRVMCCTRSSSGDEKEMLLAGVTSECVKYDTNVAALIVGSASPDEPDTEAEADVEAETSTTQ